MEGRARHPSHFFPVTQDNVAEVYQRTFPVWTRALGLCDFQVSEGRVIARLPASADLALSIGVMSGQAILAAIDTVAALAAATTRRAVRASVYQHAHFLKAASTDLEISADVQRFGASSAYVLVGASDANGDLVAHAAAEFALRAD